MRESVQNSLPQSLIVEELVSWNECSIDMLRREASFKHPDGLIDKKKSEGDIDGHN